MSHSFRRVPGQSYLFTLICTLFVAAMLSCGLQTEAPRTGMPYDWSHHYVVYGGGLASPDVMRAVRDDPRYWHQRLRQASAPQLRRHINIDPDPQRVDWSVNLGGASSTLGDGQFPAKYTFDVNAQPSCTNDYVVYALNVAGSSSQATIVAYNNLYSEPGGTGFCAGTGPKLKWAYNTGGAINTSPSLSLDGTKVAWVANANPPVLHVLKIGTTGSNGTSVTSPAVAGVGNNAVDTAVSYGGVGDTRSSVFVDYKHDTAYVASDDGNMHKFSGVFHATPAEVTTGWPLHVIDTGNHKIAGPVFDQTSHNLYYDDDFGSLAYMREVGSTVGTCISQPVPPCLGQANFSLTSGQPFIVEPPIVDSVNQTVFAYVSNDDQGTGHARVLQSDTSFTVINVEPLIGVAGQTLFSGAFDHSYFTSPQTGHLYVCGYQASGTASPVLYRLTFNSAGKMTNPHDTNSLALASTSTATHCSPMTEFFNTTTGKDWLFAGVENGCAATGGTACVMSMDITSGFPSAITQSRAEAGGTSGIVVDNVSSVAQASSIYFSTLTTTTCGDGNSGGGCAVKLTQAGLN